MKYIILFATYLSQSQKYLIFKDKVRDILINPKCRYKRFVDYFMIILVVISILLLIHGSTNILEAHHKVLDKFILYVFVVEYILRVWIYKDIHKIILETDKKNQFIHRKTGFFQIFKKSFILKWEYLKTPLAIIDLLAILPNFRALRFFRIFLVFRLLKLFRYTKNINKFLLVIQEKRFELFSLLILLGFAILLSSVAMYIFEVNENPNIGNVFDSVYWSYVTIASLGYGDISPVSTEGRVITLFLILFGFAFISFATSIITSSFSDKINEIKDEKIKSKIEKLEKNSILFGFNAISIKLYWQLINSKNSAIIVCDTFEESEEAYSQKILAIHGDSKNTKFLKEVIGINQNAIRVITLADSDIKNLHIILTVRLVNRDIEIISIIENNQSQRKFQLAGVTSTLYPYHIFSRMATTYIKYPNVFKIMEAIIFENNNIFVEEFYVSKNKFVLNKKVKDIEFSKFKLILFGILRNNKFLFKPDNEIIFEQDDILILFGNRETLNYFV